MIETNWNPSERDLRQFSAIWLPLFVIAVGAVVLYRFESGRAAILIWAAGLTACAVGFAMPAVARVLYVGLLAAAFPIGWLVSHLVLAAVYFMLFLPIGLALRLSGHDPLDRKAKGSRNSYWVSHEPDADPAAYFRQF